MLIKPLQSYRVSWQKQNEYVSPHQSEPNNTIHETHWGIVMFWLQNENPNNANQLHSRIFINAFVATCCLHNHWCQTITGCSSKNSQRDFSFTHTALTILNARSISGRPPPKSQGEMKYKNQ